MLTRSQVARRLGKSIATVRRIEGVLLRPVQDAHGVHRFDADEVDALAEDIVQGTVSLWAELQGDNDSDDGSPGLLQRRCADAEAKAAKLQRENAALREFALKLCSSDEFRRQVRATMQVR